MEFQYSKDPTIVKRVNLLKTSERIVLFIILLLGITCINLIFKFGNILGIILIGILFFLLVVIIFRIYNKYISSIIKDALEKELNPELFLNLNIYFAKKKSKNSTSYNYALSNIALAYLYDGKFDESEKVLKYLEKRELDKVSKALLIQKRILIYFYKKEYGKVKELKDKLLEAVEGIDQNLKNEILSNLEEITAMIEEDKDKLNIICQKLEMSNRKINMVKSLYIKSLFFEEGDNKYEKKLAFEGGNLFFAREELEDQSITTKNNIKPSKYTSIKVLGITTLIILIITSIVTFILNIL